MFPHVKIDLNRILFIATNLPLSPRHGALTGQKIAYIYPDFHTALIGLFVDGVMKEAQEVS